MRQSCSLWSIALVLSAMSITVIFAQSGIAYKSPLGACEVESLSLKRMKRELRKRGTECADCQDKRSHGLALIQLINLWFPALTDEQYAELEHNPEAPWIAGNTKTVTEFSAELVPAVVEDPDAWKKNYLSRVVAIYQVHDPPAIKNVLEVLKKWAGREEHLLDVLIKRYGAGEDARVFRTPEKKLKEVLKQHGVELPEGDKKDEL